MPNSIWAPARGAGASINLSCPPFPVWWLRGSGVELARTLPHFVLPPATQRGASAAVVSPPQLLFLLLPCASFAHNVTEISVTRASTRVVYEWNLPPLGLFMGLGVGAFKIGCTRWWFVCPRVVLYILFGPVIRFLRHP